MASPHIVVSDDNEQTERELVADALRNLYLRSHRVIDRAMREQGASFARTKLLFLLAKQGPSRSIDLATFFGYAPRTITEAIDGLERDGLVRRAPDPEDRRAKRISLTDRGLAAVQDADTARRDFIDRAFGVLSPSECRTIVELINRVNERLAELEG